MRASFHRRDEQEPKDHGQCDTNQKSVTIQCHLYLPFAALFSQAPRQGSRERMSLSVNPLIFNTFRGEETPEAMVMSFFGMRNVSASKDTTASFAFPFSGFAVTRTFRASPSHPSTLVLDDPGTTLILSQHTFFRHLTHSFVGCRTCQPMPQLPVDSMPDRHWYFVVFQIQHNAKTRSLPVR